MAHSRAVTIPIFNKTKIGGSYKFAFYGTAAIPAGTEGTVGGTIEGLARDGTSQATAIRITHLPPEMLTGDNIIRPFDSYGAPIIKLGDNIFSHPKTAVYTNQWITSNGIIDPASPGILITMGDGVAASSFTSVYLTYGSTDTNGWIFYASGVQTALMGSLGSASLNLTGPYGGTATSDPIDMRDIAGYAGLGAVYLESALVPNHATHGTVVFDYLVSPALSGTYFFAALLGTYATPTAGWNLGNTIGIYPFAKVRGVCGTSAPVLISSVVCVGPSDTAEV